MYILNWDYSHSIDSERDAFVVPFEHYKNAGVIFNNYTHREKFPTKILFSANLKVVNMLDYPLTDLGVPIMSSKLLELIDSHGIVESIRIPVVMFDDTHLGEKFDKSGNLNSNIEKNEKFSVLVLKDQFDCFDYENSIYEPSEFNPSVVGHISNLVLKSNLNYPPIFRIKENPVKLFVSRQLKETIEAHNCAGCIFEPVSMS